MSLYITDENGKLHKLAGAGGGASSTINVDSELNAQSENPVQNKVLYNPVTFAESERQKSKNLFDGKFRQGNYQTTSTTNRLFSQTNVPLKKGVTYTLSTDLDLNTFRFAINYASIPYPLQSNEHDLGWATSNVVTFTPEIDGYLGIPVSYKNDSNINTSAISSVKWQLEVGSVATDMQPYSGAILHEKDISVGYPQCIAFNSAKGSEVSVNAGNNWTFYPLTEHVITLDEDGDYYVTVFGHVYTSQYTAGIGLKFDNESQPQEPISGTNANSSEYNRAHNVRKLTKGEHSVAIGLWGRGTMKMPGYHSYGYLILRVKGDS